MTPIAVEPIGTRKASGFRCPGGWSTWEEPTFPEWSRKRGAELRCARIAADMGLREACAKLGSKAVDLSSLEFGRAVLSDDEHRRAIAIYAGGGT